MVKAYKKLKNNFLASGKENYLILGIFLVFLFMRLYRLGYHEFWYDEIGSLGYAKNPWYNWNAPLYWIILHFWIKIFGTSEFSLRFPSLIFNFFTVLLVFLFAKKFFNQRIALLATLFMGLSPFQIWYAQEARDYSTVLFFGTLSSYFLFQLRERRKFSTYLFFILASLCGIFSNYFYIPLFFSQLFYVVYSEKLRRELKIYLAFFLIAILFSFYLPRFLNKFFTVSKGFWVFKPYWQAPGIILQNFVLGYNATATMYFLASIPVLISFFMLLGIMRQNKKLRENITACFFLFFLPMGMIFCFSKIFFSIYLNRGLILFSPYFYLCLSSGLSVLGKNTRFIFTVSLAFLILLANYLYFQDKIFMPLEYHPGSYIKKPIKPIVNFLNKQINADDLVALTNESLSSALDFYDQKTDFTYYYFFDPQILESSWKTPIQEDRFVIPYHKIAQLPFSRLWVLSADWERSGNLDENSRQVKKWLDHNLKLVLSKEFDGLWIFAYEKK